jgi:hypothetical protein
LGIVVRATFFDNDSLSHLYFFRARVFAGDGFDDLARILRAWASQRFSISSKSAFADGSAAADLVQHQALAAKAALIDARQLR